MSLDDDARAHLRDAIVNLIRCEPERWPEILAEQAGAACHLSPGALNLLADAAVQVAATAHRLTQEMEDDG